MSKELEQNSNYINIPKVCKILNKSFDSVTNTDWQEIQKLNTKLHSSSTFAHKFSKKGF